VAGYLAGQHAGTAINRVADDTQPADHGRLHPPSAGSGGGGVHQRGSAGGAAQKMSPCYLQSYQIEGRESKRA
jgi:hypothetical protein